MVKKYDFLIVIKDVTSHFQKIQSSEYLSEGKFQIVDQGKNPIAGYTDDETLINFDAHPIIIFGDHTKIFGSSGDRVGIFSQFSHL